MKKRRIWVGLAVVLLALTTGACVPQVKQLRHDPATAAAEAEKFVTLLVVDDDVAAALRMMSQEDQAALPAATFAEQLETVHSDGRPSSVKATQYEQLPGQAAMLIYLTGAGDSGEFYYRVEMYGTMDAGYRPHAIFRGDGKYPASELRHPL